MNATNERDPNVTKYLTAQEVADHFRVSLSTVYGQVKAAKNPWPCLRVGRQLRFSPEHVAQIEAGPNSQDSQDSPTLTGKQKIKSQLKGFAA